jgi:hypothetical protein
MAATTDRARRDVSTRSARNVGGVTHDRRGGDDRRQP